MPNTHSTLTALFADIADSIRSKAGTSAPIVADAFPAAIDAIPTGGGGDSDIDALIERTISSYTNANVSVIGTNAFTNCFSITTVNFPACTCISGFAFQSCARLTTVSFPVCTSIGQYAFSWCGSLTTVNFPACISISSSAFFSCYRLTTFSFPACTSIGHGAFYNCFSLTTASFPVCTSIDSYIFCRCRNLLSVYFLGSSVPSLKNINAFLSTPISDYTISTGGVHGSIIVQASMLDAFKTATNWSIYSDRFSVWNGVD